MLNEGPDSDEHWVVTPEEIAALIMRSAEIDARVEKARARFRQRTEPSAVLLANAALMESYRVGWIDLYEAERLALIAGLLEERCSFYPWYAECAKDDPEYWASRAGSMGNLFAGVEFRGVVIPDRDT